MISDRSKIIEEKLTELILNQLFLVLAGGFVASGIAKGSLISSAFAYQVTLWFLYQILFLLYAEARCFRPIDNKKSNLSIYPILTQISTTINQKQKFSLTSTEIYYKLLVIFQQINSGENAAGFLQYGGELFRFSSSVGNVPPVNQFLLKNKLNDADLALILNLLTRLDGEWIDYQLLEVQYLGNLYQQLLEYHIEIVDTSLGNVIFKRNTHQRKLTASYYTPDYIVKGIVTETLTPILQQRVKKFKTLMNQYYESKQLLSSFEIQVIQQKAWETLLNFKICDLAMGSGHFLVVAVDFITTEVWGILTQFSGDNFILKQLAEMKADFIQNCQEKGIPVNANLTVKSLLYHRVINHCIYGVDIDAIAVELAKFSLWLQLLSQGISLLNLETHLYWGNAVTSVPWKESLYFDAIIGNPPYAILRDELGKETLSQFKKTLKQNQELQPSLGGKLDLFKIFIALSIQLVRKQGLIGLIVPMSFLGDQQSSRLRKFILSEVKIIKIHTFPQKDDPNRRVFKDAKLPTCIIYLQKIKPNNSTFQVIIHPGKDLNQIYGQFNCTATDLNLLNSDQSPIPLLKSNAELKILKKLHQNPNLQPLNAICSTYQGEINETNMAQLLSLDAREGEQVLRGGNIQRYEFIPQPKQGKAKYLKVKDYQKVIQGDRIHHCQKMRIGYQRNAALDSWKRLLFAPLPCPCYCFDSISYFLVQDQTQAFALLALLNSKLIEWRFQITSSNNHVSTAEIAALPIPNWKNFTEFKSSHQDFKQLQTDYQRYRITGDDHLLLHTVNGYIDCDRNDLIYSFLAYLAEQMIALHQQKQLEIKRFLNHLLNDLGLPQNFLNSKTKIMNYLGNYQKDEPHLPFPKFLQSLNKNIPLDLSSVSVQKQIEKQYRESLEKLLPLKNKLSLTDHLIDAVIYQLYGLTSEEIKIVEERWQS